MTRSLLETCNFRGYDDPNIQLEDVTRQMAMNYYAALMHLAEARMNGGDANGCRAVKRFVLETLPIERLEPSDDLREAILDLCVPADTVTAPVQKAADSSTPDQSTP